MYHIQQLMGGDLTVVHYDKAYRLSFTDEAKAILNQLTLKEKVALMGGHQSLQDMLEILDQDESQHYNFAPITSGGNAAHGIPEMGFCDGPRGVVCDLGKSTCFPVSMCRGATFDTELEERIGHAIGRETRAFGGNLFAGICINLPYHPGWGRSQETYGEESFHLGQMGAALARGVQDENVIGCVKHYAFNQMEISRFKVSVDCDKRTEREVFLPHFKDVIDAGAGSVMSSYNLFQGVHCGHHNYLLNHVLKDEWDFDGFVMSDFIWGVLDTVEAANGGQDMEMCCTNYFGDKLVKAVEDGFVSEDKINEAALRIIRTLISLKAAQEADGRTYTEDMIGCEEHINLALQAAREGITLLKNKNHLLPLDKNKVRKVAVIGRLAGYECIGDHGSSTVYPRYVVTPLAGLKSKYPEIEFIHHDGSDRDALKALIAQTDAAIMVCGYDFNDEGEYVSEDENEAYTGAIGGDRQDLHLHANEADLIQYVSALTDNLAVVLIGGNTIMMDPWFENVPAVLMAYYPGMEGGTAIAEILFGDVNPSGKLPFVVPKDAADLPKVIWDTKHQYYEYYHGYTRLEKQGIEPLLPYGFGLSYTDFAFDEASFESDGQTVTATCKVTNTGDAAGSEVVQMYVGFTHSSVDRPVKQLRGFKRVTLAPGEAEYVTITCPVEKLEYYNPVENEMQLEHMNYEVYIGNCSDNAHLLKGVVAL